MCPGHYFDADPAVPSRPGAVELSLPDFHARLAVDRGVFSGAGIDPGTLELLRASPPPPARGHLLDLGCGYGPIACTLAHRAPGDGGVGGGRQRPGPRSHRPQRRRPGPARGPAVRPDGVPASVRFAGMWSNPPIRIGKAALHELLGDLVAPPRRRWAGLDGRAPPSGRRLAGGLAARPKAWAVNRAGSKRGYRILEVSRP